MKDVIRKERRISKAQERKTINAMRSGQGAQLSKSMGHIDSSAKGKGLKFPPLNVKGSQVQHFQQRKTNDLQFEDLSKVQPLVTAALFECAGVLQMCC